MTLPLRPKERGRSQCFEIAPIECRPPREILDAFKAPFDACSFDSHTSASDSDLTIRIPSSQRRLATSPPLESRFIRA